MLWQQKWERRLLQSFNVRVAKTTQKISLAQMALCVMAFHYSPPFVGLILFQIVWQIGCRYVKICTNISTCTWFKHAFTTYIQAIKSMIWSDAEVAFKDHFPRTRYLRLAQSLCGSFLYARLKNGTNLGTPAAGGPIMFAGGMSTGLPLSKSKSLIRSLSNLVNMLVGIISQLSSITCQIPPLLNYGPWIVQKLN